MPLVKDGAPVADPYVAVADDAELPEGAGLVSADRLLAGVNARGPLGVAWPNDRDVSALAPFLPQLSLIALNLPKFRDGRAFSQARLLRERYGFKGELRATGNVLRDQLLMLSRSGFDAFEVQKEADAAAFGATLSSYSIFYQPTGDGRPTAAGARAEAAERPAAAKG